MIEAGFYRKDEPSLGSRVAKELFLDPKRVSVTRLERFASCAYAHFLNYGLRLLEREKYGFEAMDLGNIAHQALERFAHKVEEEGLDWVTMPEEKREQLIDESVEESILDYGNTVLFSSARNEYMIHRIKQLINRSVWALTQQMAAGDFVPSGCEFKFGSGKIDRIDTCEDENAVYVKVTDYKTGRKAFDITAFYHGLQMQLPVYLNAALEIERQKHPEKEVLPAGIFYYRIQVEDEDSLTERFDRKQEAGVIDIAVVRTPRISNFTDFNPFESIPGVSLRYVKHPRDLHSPDMIILPGTKNTMGDLILMRESGMEAAVLKEASRGKLIFGVCGGYQMLGETLSDPHGVENGGSMKGMGLLPMETVFAEKKTRTRVQGHFGQLSGVFAPLSGAEIEGYEIHMGESILKDNAGTATKITDSVSGKKKEEGAFAGNVCGTYIHGVFDKEASAEAIIRVIGEKKGIDVENMTGVDFAAFKEQQYDILAAELRKHLDMKKIYEILENGITEEE